MKDTEIAINVENISKRYRIGLKENMHDSLLKTTIDLIKSPLINYRKYRSLYTFDDMPPDDDSTTPSDIIWPLKNVSFQVKCGEIVGIIGRNGAGKSTLLKILSRITDPTRGRIEIRGKVSSLLEVGTGFHPELTGKENVYLNGTILGMRKKEVESKFDEIVDFSEMRKFIDTPVKRYSSGMRVRLAFAVAAHLEAEILFIDEVLAVGDEAFQRKCLKKMEDIGQHGRTVLFVSHNMQAVNRLCPRSILLEDGRIVEDGPSDKVVNKYLSASTGTMAERIWHDPQKAPSGEIARLIAIRVHNKDGVVTESMDIAETFGIDIEYEVLKPGFILLCHHHFINEEGVHVFSAHDTDPAWQNKPRPRGRYVSTTWIPGNLLSDGMLVVNSGLTTLNPKISQFWEVGTVAFQIVEGAKSGGARGIWAGTIRGSVRPFFKWSTEFTPCEGIVRGN